MDLKLYRVRDIDDIKLADIRVVFVDMHDQLETGISFGFAVDADIETVEEHKYCNHYWSCSLLVMISFMIVLNLKLQIRNQLSEHLDYQKLLLEAHRINISTIKVPIIN